MPLVIQVHQPSRCRHQHIGSCLQGFHLRCLPHAAKNHGCTYWQIFSILGKILLNLQSQLPGRGENQRPDRLMALPDPALKPLQNGNGEGRGFSGAGLGAANEVPPRQHMGDGRSLNR